MKNRIAVAFILCGIPLFAQMTRDQRLLDFQQLAALYAKQYAPYEWKRDAIGFDLLKLEPWVARIDKAKDDVEFLEICAEYVGSLKDGHSQFIVPSNFFADNGLFIDMYEGKVLVDLIDRRLLPERDFPIEVGDEVISVDGKLPETLLREMTPFVASGNRRATQRFALDLVVFRPQFLFPRAHQVPARSRYLIRKRDGSQEAYDIPWVRQGVPITVIGPVPSPTLRDQPAPEPEFLPVDLVRSPFRGLPELRKARVEPIRAVKGYGALQPPFNPPAGFTQRLGRPGRDALFTGTYTASGQRIGFIRIPEMYISPFAANLAVGQLVQELAFMERNTDGLIMDVMRNPGGDACLAQDIVSLVMPNRFKMPGVEIRATREWINRYELLISGLQASGAARWITDLLTAMLGDIRGAYSENRGRTGALPICDLGLEVEPARDSRGNRLSYTKPLMVLTDELSASAAEIVASAVQDNDRGIILGMPTLGAGGTVSPSPLPTGWYSESSATVTQGLLVRPRPATSGGEFPGAPYIENIGVRPDVRADIMTRENLLNNGRTFVEAFTAAMVAHITAQ